MKISFIKPWSHLVYRATLSTLLLFTQVTVIQAASDEDTDTSLSRVEVKTVMESKVLPAITVTGHIYSRNTLQVMAGIDAQLDWVAEPGTSINEGDPIARFNVQTLNLEKVEQEAIIQREQGQLKYINREVQRLNALKQANAISSDALDKALSRRDLVLGDLHVAKARLSLIEDRLSKTLIASPFTGVIIERRHQQGEEVRRGSVLATLQDTHNLELRTFIPLEHIQTIHVGDTLQLSTTHHTTAENTLPAIIRAIIPASDIRSQTFEARIDIPKSKQQWTVGQMLHAQIPVAPKHTSLAVHRDAVLLRAQGNYVMKISSNNIATTIPVTLGKAQGEWIEIEGQLHAGDQVAVKGAERLADQQNVLIENET